MKRIRCPKCDNYIVFDETKYDQGQSLVFVCDACGKQFGIRIGTSKLRALQKDENVDDNLQDRDFGFAKTVKRCGARKRFRQERSKRYQPGPPRWEQGGTRQ